MYLAGTRTTTPRARNLPHCDILGCRVFHSLFPLLFFPLHNSRGTISTNPSPSQLRSDPGFRQPDLGEAGLVEGLVRCRIQESTFRHTGGFKKLPSSS